MDSGESRRKPRATLRLASRFFQREIVKKKRFLQKSAAAACTPRGLKISEASEDERKKFSFLTVFPPGKLRRCFRGHSRPGFRRSVFLLRRYIIAVSADESETRADFQAIKKKYPDAFLVKISGESTSRLQ